jgi:prostatic aicd phosphatase
MWIKGDEVCPAFTIASASFKQSPIYLDNLARTKSFYSQFWSVLQNVWDYTPANLTYAKAYDIFDLVNVASIHNRSITANVTAEQLFQLRTLADSAEFNNNFNASQPDRSIGGAALAGQVFSQLNQTVSSQGKLKFSLVTPSYNNQLGLFGLTKLTAASPDFFGLPPYASTLTFELFTQTNMSAFPSVLDDLMVRALFRNGSDGAAPLVPFALFGRPALSMSWKDFSAEMLKVAITSTSQWCKMCNSTATFCLPYAAATTSGAPVPTATAIVSQSVNGTPMSNVVAGVIGAMVTLSLVLAGGLAFLLLRRRLNSNKTANGGISQPQEKSPSIGESDV